MTNIKLYRNCEIREEKNFAVDDIERYLRDLVPVKTFDSTQYIKQGLDITVNVKLDQTYLDREWTNMYNYCRIENGGGDDNCCYYFIRDKQWISKDAIKLVLHMDVINTYKEQVKLTDKTTINRQHKDRFINNRLPEIVEEQFSFLDDAEWDWGVRAGELVGNADFTFSDELFDRSVNATITLVTGIGADVYETEWDADFNTLHVTAYVQGETSPIPQGKIKITVVAPTTLSSAIYRKVDEVSEGIETVLFNRLAMVSSDDKDNAYLIYKTNNAYDSADPDAFIYNNAVNCFLTTDNGYEARVSSDVVVEASELAANTRYYLSLPCGAADKMTPNSFSNDLPNPKPPVTIKIIGQNGKETTMKMFKVNEKRNKQTTIHFVVTSAGHISIIRSEWKRDNIEERNDYLGDFGTSITIKDMSEVTLYTSTKDYANVQNLYTLLVRNPGASEHIISDDTDTKTSKPFDEVDRTDIQLIKIVKLPYVPSFFATDLEWNASERMFKLKSKTLNKNAIGGYLSISLNPVQELVLPQQLHTFTSDVLRNDLYESKLWHSDFFNYKFVYDSFNYTFEYENLLKSSIEELSSRQELEMDYIVSTSVASTFLFDFSRGWTEYQSKSDYPEIMIVNRNLEVPIYNNYYLNYLRNGYNYDVKNKQASQTATGIGIGLSAASLVAGIALSATGVGSAMGATAIAGGVAGLVGSISSGIVSSVQADRALQQKQQDAKNQSASVSGCDDLGLLSYYCVNNKPKLVAYAVSDTTHKRIADLFYYCGYRCDYQDIPDVHSRYWFNFIQCDPVYDEDNTTAKMSKDCKEELSSKYQQGITFLHGHYNAEDDETEYDFKQVKENWETWLIA